MIHKVMKETYWYL